MIPRPSFELSLSEAKRKPRARRLVLRIERAIDAFLDWRRIERDATPRSVDSYWRILVKLAEDYPEVQITELTTEDLRRFLKRWSEKSAATRSNVISVLHSFFRWAESEDWIEIDPSRKIRRPPKRKPDVYRPSLAELARIRAAALLHEKPAILLMEGVGLRRSEVIGCRWGDIDLLRGRVRVLRKGRNWQRVPVDPDVLLELRVLFRELTPELEDYVFVVEVEQWVSQFQRERKRKDPKKPASEQALWRMVERVCRRAGVRPLSPHQLRHGFANRFAIESERDLVALQALMGHSRPDTTQAYTDEVDIEELAAALDRAAYNRRAQTSSGQATPHPFAPDEAETLEWRRRESNPRPRSHRTGRLRA
jgi:site-specific recombinase XerD